MHVYFQEDAAAGRSFGCMPKHRSTSLYHCVLSDFRVLLQVLLGVLVCVQLIPNSSTFVPLSTGHVSYECWKYALLRKFTSTFCPKTFLKNAALPKLFV